MNTRFTINEPVQYDRLLAEFETLLQNDIGEGRAFLARERAPGGRAHDLPAALVGTIEKNIDIQEKMYREMIRHAEAARAETDRTLDVRDFYQQYVLSAANATFSEPDYFPLLIQRQDITNLPEDIRAQMGTATGVAADDLVMSLVPVRADQLTEEGMACMRARMQTVQLITRNLFNAFYLASTGRAAFDENPAEYQAFMRQAERWVHGGQGSSGPGSRT